MESREAYISELKSRTNSNYSESINEDLTIPFEIGTFQNNLGDTFTDRKISESKPMAKNSLSSKVSSFRKSSESKPKRNDHSLKKIKKNLFLEKKKGGIKVKIGNLSSRSTTRTQAQSETPDISKMNSRLNKDKEELEERLKTLEVEKRGFEEKAKLVELESVEAILRSEEILKAKAIQIENLEKEIARLESNREI